MRETGCDLTLQDSGCFVFELVFVASGELDVKGG